jgi:hypothetical protein
MEWSLNIPKILYLYWGGGNYHYLRFLTVKTFMKYNPDWEIVFMYPKYPTNNVSWHNPDQRYKTQCTDFMSEVMKLPITKMEIDFTKYGFSNDMSEVHKSDFIRLVQLSTIGGVWSDMDIIYFKPMTSLYFNKIENKHIETFYCDHNYGHSVGFLMASEGNKFFGKLMNIAQQEHTPLEYQSMGAIIYKKHFSTSESINELTPAMNISMNVIYAHDATYFPEILTNATPKFTDESIGLHWYAGSNRWKSFLEETDGGLKNIPNNIIGNLINNAK